MHNILLALLLSLSIATPTADEQFRSAQQLVQQADAASLKQAVAALQDALRLGYADRYAAHRLLLQAYEGLGDQPNVKKEMEAVLALNPDDRDVRLMWIDTLPPKEQLAELHKLVDRWPDAPIVHFFIARAALATGDFDQAATSARRWLDLAPADEQRDLMANLFAGRSEEELRRVLKSDASLYPASFTLSMLLIEKQGSDAYEQLRAFYRNAPARIATAVSAPIFQQLKKAGRVAEGQRLLQEFGTKLEEGSRQQ